MILASASHARKCLLEQVRIPHRVMVSGVNEQEFFSSDPNELVKTLALAKARAVGEHLSLVDTKDYMSCQKTTILGCDSVFVFQGEIFGKPREKKEAIDRLKRMSLCHGLLYTGHALLYSTFNSSEDSKHYFDCLIEGVVVTKVYFAELTDSEIQNYVSTNEPFKCAGGFTLDGQGGWFVDRIEGCYSNVLGLSLPWLRQALIRISI